MYDHVKKILDAKSDEELRNFVHHANHIKGVAHGKRKDLHPKVHESHNDNSVMSAETKAQYDKTHARVRAKKDVIHQHVAAVREYLKTRPL